MQDTHRLRPRLTDEQTEQRMFSAALRRVSDAGLGVSIDGLSFEELIVEAQVSRSSVYRRWRHREDFDKQLLIKLLQRGTGLVHYYSAENLYSLMPSPSDLTATTVDERRAIMLEMVRIGIAQNFSAVHESAENQTHTALTALVGNVDNSIREEAINTLRESEAEFLDRMSEFYASALQVVGFRLREGVSFLQIAALGSAIVQGFVNHSIGFPPHLLEENLIDPFGLGVKKPWTTVALGFASMLMSLTEPNPEFGTHSH